MRVGAEQEFEAKGLGAFGGGNDSAVVWRDRVDAQDAYAAAAQAKAAALQRKEETLAAKRTLLARLEACVHALSRAEEDSAAAAESARVALADLDDHVEVSCWPLLLSMYSKRVCERLLGIPPNTTAAELLLDVHCWCHSGRMSKKASCCCIS